MKITVLSFLLCLAAAPVVHAQVLGDPVDVSQDFNATRTSISSAAESLPSTRQVKWTINVQISQDKP